MRIREQGLVILESYFVAYAYVQGFGELAFFCFCSSLGDCQDKNVR